MLTPKKNCGTERADLKYTAPLDGQSLFNLNNDLQCPSHASETDMESARLAQFFAQQERRTNNPSDVESRDKFIARLARTRPQYVLSEKETRHQETRQDAQSKERPESLKANQKPRHHDLESKGPFYENEVLSSTTSEPISRDSHSDKASSVLYSTSVKRKSSDQESGLLERDGHPGKKTRRHLDGDGVPDIPGRSAAAAYPATSTRQSEKLEKSRLTNNRPENEQHRAPATGSSTCDSPPENPRAPQQSTTIIVGGGSETRMKETPLMSNSDGGIDMTNSKAADVRGRAAGSKNPHLVPGAADTLGKKAPTSLKPRAAVAATAKSTHSGSIDTVSESSKTSKQTRNTSLQAPAKVGSPFTKPPLVIPRYSEIKRTKKDGTPRAPVDINLAIRRVGERRRKIEDKTLCDTGTIEMDEFIYRLYQFYDDEEMRRRSRKTKFLGGLVIYFCPSDYKEIGMAARKKLLLLAAHGAEVVPTFDQERVTHIVVQEGVKETGQLLFRMKLESIDDIPEHIPILRWGWVDASWKKQAPQPIHEYPAFKTRVTFAPGYTPPSPPPDVEPPPQPSNEATASSSSIQCRPTPPDEAENSSSSDDEERR
ncbi:hypothetical protein BDY19DRAFT_234289 [Irpex rosettiformis]|uniref:Uncharacterized protein n=1 Tax=Irpex rosettiformis TaxID=378272 RepID=A0ACB8TZX2_9APHY|nr:hypothetical protein BDY19DRAFT_234289 [Irpex rosettiformis]